MFVDNNNDEFHINILQNGLGNDGDGQGDRSDLQKRQTTGKMTLALGFLTISNDLHFFLFQLDTFDKVSSILFDNGNIKMRIMVVVSR